MNTRAAAGPRDDYVNRLTAHFRAYGDGREGELWHALMTCCDCPHRMIEHDYDALRCLSCRCDQSGRGLSSFADDRLADFGRALTGAYGRAPDA